MPTTSTFEAAPVLVADTVALLAEALAAVDALDARLEAAAVAEAKRLEADAVAEVS